MNKIDEKNLIMEDLRRAVENLRSVEKKKKFKSDVDELDHKASLEHAKFRVSYLRKQLEEAS